MTLNLRKDRRKTENVWAVELLQGREKLQVEVPKVKVLALAEVQDFTIRVATCRSSVASLSCAGKVSLRLIGLSTTK
jgi:hypothetical protein